MAEEVKNYISKIVATNGTTYFIKDEEVRESLSNYYTKSETYSQSEVNNLIEAINQFEVVVASVLPTASEETMRKIYLIPKDGGEGQNIKDEYITIKENNVYKWEKIGDTTIDISGKEDTSNKVTTLTSGSTDVQYPSAKCVYDIITENELVTSQAINQLEQGKQDKLTAGTNITISGNTISATVESSDENVKQTLSNATNESYAVLTKYNTGNNSPVTAGTKFSSGVTITPGSGVLNATKVSTDNLVSANNTSMVTYANSAITVGNSTTNVIVGSEQNGIKNTNAETTIKHSTNSGETQMYSNNEYVGLSNYYSATDEQGMFRTGRLSDMDNDVINMCYYGGDGAITKIAINDDFDGENYGVYMNLSNSGGYEISRMTIGDEIHIEPTHKAYYTSYGTTPTANDEIATVGNIASHTSNSAIHVTANDKSVWNAKQPALVSGVNIKTVNGNSLLGSGNISIDDTKVTDTHSNNRSYLLGHPAQNTNATTYTHNTVFMEGGMLNAWDVNAASGSWAKMFRLKDSNQNEILRLNDAGSNAILATFQGSHNKFYFGDSNHSGKQFHFRGGPLYAEEIYSNNMSQTSDIRKKNVIGEVDLEKAYEMIDKCSTIIYTLKDDPNAKEQIGAIAQEVREFFPEIVNEDSEGMLSLDYSRITIVLMRVMKDIINRLNKLEK